MKTMNRRVVHIIFAAAIIALIIIIIAIVRNKGTPAHDDLPELPEIHTKSPFAHYISAIGIIEPSSNNISIGVPMTRVVKKLFVTAGAKVNSGDPLLILENRDLKAELLSQQTNYKTALLNLEKLQALRPDNFAASQAALDSAEADYEQAKRQDEMVQGLQDTRALSLDEINRRHYAVEQSKAKWLQAQADFKKAQESNWKLDLELSNLSVMQARANMERVQAELDRTIVRSPINGTVLQIRIREGEMPPMDTQRSPLMVLGNIDNLYVRVNINQYDLPSYSSKATAVAYLQGYGSKKYELEFVQLEPYLTEKQNINNNIMEKIDTYVLHVLYRIKKQGEANDPHLYVGQKMDVFIEAEYHSEQKK
jgi:HlyD family secretion protein